MALSHNLLISVLLAYFTASAVMARPLPASKSTLMARLKVEDEEGSSTCWDSLFQLQSCTVEVVLFFLNGETYLGPGCCSAIRTIERECWPSMLSSLGYTSEEGDILRGYCDATDSDSPPPPHIVGPNMNASQEYSKYP